MARFSWNSRSASDIGVSQIEVPFAAGVAACSGGSGGDTMMGGPVSPVLLGGGAPQAALPPEYYAAPTKVSDNLRFTSIAASFPGAMWSIAGGADGGGKFVIVLAVVVLVIALVVFVEQSQRRIPVQYAKRMVGRRMYGGSSTYIPIKINMAGVIPVIFAS